MSANAAMAGGGAAAGVGAIMMMSGVGAPVGAALMIAGGLTSAYGAYEEGQAAGTAADYNAALARRNADLARQQANEQARRLNVQAQEKIGQGVANVGASGVTMSGSALAAIQESAANAELDRRSVINKGEQTAYGYNATANLDVLKGQTARTSGDLSAAGTLLGTAGKVAGNNPSPGTLPPDTAPTLTADPNIYSDNTGYSGTLTPEGYA